MYTLAKIDKSITLNEKKDQIVKSQWNDVKKYLGQPREVYEQVQNLKDTILKGQVNRKLLAKAQDILAKTQFDEKIPANKEITLIAEFIMQAVELANLIPKPFKIKEINSPNGIS